jgi:transcriptional regulator with XRE-family HTH domain
MTTKYKKASAFLRDHLGEISFGEYLHSLRLANEWTQVEMAIRLEISKQELCDIEKNRKIISIERAILFARKLKHSEKFFIKYVIDDHLKRSGVKLKFSLDDAA